MFTPTNSQREEMRAQAIVNSLTDANKAADVFARKPRRTADTTESSVNRSDGFAVRMLQAFTLRRRPAAGKTVQQSIYAPQQVMVSGETR